MSEDLADEPHYLGHRGRLRERFLDTPEALPDYEVLELLLTQLLPRRDMKPLAKTLLSRFGSISGVLSAPPAELAKVKGLGETTIANLGVIREVAARMLREQARTRDVLGSWQALLDYCRSRLAHETAEQFRVLYLDNRNGLIRDEVQQKGTINEAPIYPREVVRRALELGAAAIILVHNHPSGNPQPSRADIEVTKEVAKAAGVLGLRVHDHLVVGQGQPFSFRAQGLLKE
ncbi:RadC family protein [Zavarzinia sp. CC-PAN008]|uniref:RadC family protein n=1 Tax=Zavarzinia sp. CC-PAN008 TaxID=3243332 RepID=UPI003F74887C